MVKDMLKMWTGSSDTALKQQRSDEIWPLLDQKLPPLGFVHFEVIWKALKMNLNALHLVGFRVRNLKFATYLKFATCGITNKLNELR